MHLHSPATKRRHATFSVHHPVWKCLQGIKLKQEGDLKQVKGPLLNAH